MVYNPFPNRISARLDGYDYSRAGAYYVTICTKDRECIFRNPLNPKETTAEYAAADKYINNIPGIQEYVIMPDHIHMIIRFEETGAYNLADVVRSFKTMVTKEIGRKIWQPRYFERVIRGKEEYAKYAAYIRDNPENRNADEGYLPD